MPDQSVFLWIHDRVAEIFQLFNTDIFQFGSFGISFVEIFVAFTFTFVLLKFFMFRH